MCAHEELLRNAGVTELGEISLSLRTTVLISLLANRNKPYAFEEPRTVVDLTEIIHI